MPDITLDVIERTAGEELVLKEGSGITLTADGDDVIIAATATSVGVDQLSKYYWKEYNSALSAGSNRVQFEIGAELGPTALNIAHYSILGEQDGFSTTAQGRGYWEIQVYLDFTVAAPVTMYFAPVFDEAPTLAMALDGWLQPYEQFALVAGTHRIARTFLVKMNSGSSTASPFQVSFSAAGAVINKAGLKFIQLSKEA